MRLNVKYFKIIVLIDIFDYILDLMEVFFVNINFGYVIILLF